jgi:hypothetical protein
MRGRSNLWGNVTLPRPIRVSRKICRNRVLQSFPSTYTCCYPVLYTHAYPHTHTLPFLPSSPHPPPPNTPDQVPWKSTCQLGLGAGPEGGFEGLPAGCCCCCLASGCHLAAAWGSRSAPQVVYWQKGKALAIVIHLRLALDPILIFILPGQGRVHG